MKADYRNWVQNGMSYGFIAAAAASILPGNRITDDLRFQFSIDYYL